MATTQTPKLGLTKPDYDEAADVDVINDNMDKIDAAMPVIVYSGTQPAEPAEGMIWLKPIS